MPGKATVAARSRSGLKARADWLLKHHGLPGQVMQAEGIGLLPVAIMSGLLRGQFGLALGDGSRKFG
jgi:hypothetical protein